MRAIQKDSKNMFEVLLQFNADLSIKNFWGTTPMHLICQQGLKKFLDIGTVNYKH